MARTQPSPRGATHTVKGDSRSSEQKPFPDTGQEARGPPPPLHPPSSAKLRPYPKAAAAAPPLTTKMKGPAQRPSFISPRPTTHADAAPTKSASLAAPFPTTSRAASSASAASAASAVSAASTLSTVSSPPGSRQSATTTPALSSHPTKSPGPKQRKSAVEPHASTNTVRTSAQNTLTTNTDSNNDRPLTASTSKTPPSQKVSDSPSSIAAGRKHETSRECSQRSNGLRDSAPVSQLYPNAQIGIEWYSKAARGTAAQGENDKVVVFLDIDNTLYSKKVGSDLAGEMKERIVSYFASLGLSESQATQFFQHYCLEYGLAVRELSKEHNIDPVDFDARCDASLPLEQILLPDPVVQDLISSLDRTKCQVVALTNSYKTHAARVLSLIGVKGLFDACVYCDYTKKGFASKPDKEFFLGVCNSAIFLRPID